MKKSLTAAEKKPGFPPSLKGWLERSLGGLNKNQQAQINVELKQVIQSCEDVWKVDWSTEPPHRLGDVAGTMQRIKRRLEGPPPPAAAAAAEVKAVEKPKEYASPQPPPSIISASYDHSGPTFNPQHQPPVQFHPPGYFGYPPQPGGYYVPPPNGYSAYNSFPPPPMQQPVPTNYYFTAPTNVQYPTYAAAAAAPSQSPPAKRNRKRSSSDEEEGEEVHASTTIQSKCAKALVAFMQENKLKSITAGQMHDFYTQCNDVAVTKFLRKGKGSIQSVCSSAESQLKYGKNGTIKLALVPQQAPKPTSKNNSAFTLNEDPAVIAARAARFQGLTPSTTPPPPAAALRPGEIVKGTCTELEKSYLRTSSEAPHPSTIRPEPVLKLAMERITEKLSAEGKPAYAWANDQIKAIRQDLKFQHIQNEFALQVYEKHARFAIQYGGPDLNELNTCLTQLKEISSTPLQPEFATYQLLYHVYCVARYKTNKSSQISLAQVDLTKLNSQQQRNAYDIFLTLRNRQWTRYLLALRQCSQLSKEMLAPVTEFVRLNALETVCCCAVKQVPRQSVQQAMGLDAEQYAEFCAKYRVVVVGENEDVDVKATVSLVRQALEEGLVWSHLQQHSLT